MNLSTTRPVVSAQEVMCQYNFISWDKKSITMLDDGSFTITGIFHNGYIPCFPIKFISECYALQYDLDGENFLVPSDPNTVNAMEHLRQHLKEIYYGS